VVELIRGEQPAWAASGSGSGSGSGYGYGYGDGSGYGSGYGDGYGSGSGYGDGSYWLQCIQYFAAKWSQAQRDRLEQLKALGAKIAFWKSGSTGKACNGGHHSTPVHVGMVEKIKGPLRLCSKNALHATELPPKWHGERLWVVALLGEVQQSEDKYGALEREIIGQCK
jgi:hypothetical protein